MELQDKEGSSLIWCFDGSGDTVGLKPPASCAQLNEMIIIFILNHLVSLWGFLCIFLSR